jgi:hypothetical protein
MRNSTTHTRDKYIRERPDNGVMIALALFLILCAHVCTIIIILLFKDLRYVTTNITP